MTSDLLLQRAIMFVPLLLSLTVHEYAHAWSASKLGDDTAERMGRLTLNPFAHIDLFGTVLLPLLSPIPFGWAKPVPVDPSRFRRGVRMRTGTMLTASAGPLSNLGLAILCTVGLALVYRFAPDLVTSGSAVGALLQLSIQLNVALAVFNLLPIPPLDGSRVVEGLLPRRYQHHWDTFSRLAPFLLIALIVFGGPLTRVPRAVVMGLLDRLLLTLA